MEIVDRGAGDPIVVLPGIQGRWPYVEATVDALARANRVMAFSFAGERGGRSFDAGLGIDNYIDDLQEVFRVTHLDRAILVGVSFGGVVALRFSAGEPGRVRALILVSTPGPSWAPKPRHRLYATAPFVFGPLFLLESPFRVGPEIRTSLPTWRARARFSTRQLAIFARAPLSLRRMGIRLSLAAATDRRACASRITVPTLIVTGEPGLDRVVPVEGTREYTDLIPGATAVTLPDTGHLGSLTQAERFADVVHSFLEGLRDAAA
jgi:pimeloyl-ACP methyl ester carboxylesterase